MKIDYRSRALKDIEYASDSLRKLFFKQIKLLEQNLRHPSLHAKKYDEANNLWQARINKSWRFYFLIEDNVYVILSIKPHPK